MPVISKSRRDQVIYRLSQDQVAVHTRLKNINPLIGSFLLKPREEGEYLIWELENSQLYIDKITVYGNLDEVSKSLVHDQLDIIKALLAKSGDDPKILDIPSMDSIKLLDTNLGQKVVVDSWGYLPFDTSKGVNIINFTPKPTLKSVNVELLFYYFDKSSAGEHDVAVYDNGFATMHKTDQNGFLSLGGQLVGKDFQIEIKNKIRKTITVNKDNSTFEFELPFYTDVKVTVLNQITRIPINNYKVFLNYQGSRLEGDTNAEGFIVFKNIPAGEKIRVSDNKTTVNHDVTKEDNSIELWVPSEIVEEIIKNDPPITPIDEVPTSIGKNALFTVLGLDGNKMEDYDLDIQQGNNNYSTITDLENPFRKKLDSNELNMDYKSVGIVKVNEAGNVSVYKCKFKTKPNLYEYSFQIKKSRNWLWLLWLIPLLLSLMIVFGKDVNIQVKNDQGEAISDAGVNMRYHYKSLFNFNTFKFLSTDTIEVEGTTDSLGLVHFENNPTTVFDLVFKLRRDAKINVSLDTTCYTPTAALIKFYKVYVTHEIEVQNKKNYVEIYVRERDTEAPIQDAEVNLSIDGKSQEFSTDQDGRVIVNDMNLCTVIKMAYAFKDYPDFGKLYSDTIQDASIKEKNVLTLYINEPEPCRDTLREGGVEGDRILLATPNENNEYYLIYDFMNIPDQLLIYSYPDGKLIHNTGFRSRVGEFRFKPKDVCSGCKIIYMEIQTNDNNTSWKYYFKCDNN